MNKDLVRDFKWCNHCKQLLSITKFNRNKAQPDGYAYWCKSCRSKDDEYNKEYMKKYDALRSKKSGVHVKQVKNQLKKHSKIYHILAVMVFGIIMVLLLKMGLQH